MAQVAMPVDLTLTAEHRHGRGAMSEALQIRHVDGDLATRLLPSLLVRTLGVKPLIARRGTEHGSGSALNAE
jgi:hypothetical protein